MLGHLQRGGSPSAWDRQLCTRFGVSAVEQIADESYGVMVALKPSGIALVELAEAVDKIRTMPPDGEIVRVGRALGISFGSECVPTLSQSISAGLVSFIGFCTRYLNKMGRARRSRAG